MTCGHFSNKNVQLLPCYPLTYRCVFDMDKASVQGAFAVCPECFAAWLHLGRELHRRAARREGLQAVREEVPSCSDAGTVYAVACGEGGAGLEK